MIVRAGGPGGSPGLRPESGLPDLLLLLLLLLVGRHALVHGRAAWRTAYVSARKVASSAICCCARTPGLAWPSTPAS